MSLVAQVRVEQGDTLRAIALREYADVARWQDIATFNALRQPYIVQSHREQDRLPGTLIWGDTIQLPLKPSIDQRPSALALFGADLSLEQGRLDARDGDLLLTSGEPNLAQALTLRLKTLRGELHYHTQYGSNISLAIGLPGNGFSSLLASGWCHETLSEEPRVMRVESVAARVRGDVIDVDAKVTAVGANSVMDFNLVMIP